MAKVVAIVFPIYSLAIAGMTLALHYEDNVLNMAHQYASDFTAINEMLVITKQSQAIQGTPRTLCQAMMKLRHLGGNNYHYIVYSAPPSTPMSMQAFVTTLTASIDHPANGVRHHPNVLSYKTLRGGPVCSYKILYGDPLSGCFIFVTYSPSSRRACRLLQTVSTVNHGIPPHCNSIYVLNCHRQVKQIYYPVCAQRIPHIVEWDL